MTKKRSQQEVEQETNVQEQPAKKIANKLAKQGFDIMVGTEMKEPERLSTGILSLDWLYGGGLRTGFHIWWGPESIGKTSSMMKVASNAQEKLGQVVCFADASGTLAQDPNYASRMGLNPELTLFIAGETAEEVLEGIRQALMSGVQILVVDDWASLCPKKEMYKASKGTDKGKARTMSDETVGAQPLVAGKFCRMMGGISVKENARVLITQQQRTQGIGSFATYLDMPGGHAIRHQLVTITHISKGDSGDTPTVGSLISSPKCGFVQKFELRKTKGAKTQWAGTKVSVQWIYGRGWDKGRDAFLFLSTKGNEILRSVGDIKDDQSILSKSGSKILLNVDLPGLKAGKSWNSKASAEKELANCSDALLPFFLDLSYKAQDNLTPPKEDIEEMSGNEGEEESEGEST